MVEHGGNREKWGCGGAHTETERFISSVTSMGWLVTRARCGRALQRG